MDRVDHMGVVDWSIRSRPNGAEQIRLLEVPESKGLNDSWFNEAELSALNSYPSTATTVRTTPFNATIQVRENTSRHCPIGAVTK